ncbi:hypothetical protein CVIRNUC_008163 [Coccomyxa viridis]|uniref:Uncharacterized protein n=1 Tax=Coccomyxa viridis TaxID=1274662 RepID=A0AAV1ICK6_9CHLO|nr:hypothetical protein CVIRNUC_008163 [Coccomyxa viridis]
MSSHPWRKVRDGQPVHADDIADELPQQQERLSSASSPASRACSRAATCRSEALLWQSHDSETARDRTFTKAWGTAACRKQVEPTKITEGESAGCKVARGYGQSLGRKQRVPSKHLELEEGVRRMRLRIQRQEALLQDMKQGKVSVRQDAPEDTDLIPVGYITPPRALAGQPEEWAEESDGTLEGSLGYGNILESPPAAYVQLQARMLAGKRHAAAE